MNIEEFKELPESAQKEYYNKIKKEKEEHQKLMNIRCSEDVRINYMTFDKMLHDLNELYSDSPQTVNKIMWYLTFIMTIFSYQEKNRIKLDVKQCKKSLEWFTKIKLDKIEKLKKLMPLVGKKSVKKKPKKMVNKDGSDSALAVKWYDFLSDLGLPDSTEGPVEYISSYVEPNPGSSSQIKDWLFSLGWTPETFKFVDEEARDEKGKKYKTGKKRKVPQVKKDGDLCPSVKRLAESIPELEELVTYGVVVHRMGLLNGLLNNVDEEGYLVAGIAGLTSTLRIRHKVIVNLPGVTGKDDVSDGKYIRAVLIAEKGEKFIGSDVSGLETTTADHFMYPFDPDYVLEKRQHGFDAHLDMSLSANIMTQDEVDFYKWYKRKEKGEELPKKDVAPEVHRGLDEEYQTKLFKELNQKRQKAKTTNFASQYSVGANTLARNLNIPKEEAKALINGYWKRNYSIKEACKNPITKYALGRTWIKHPINKYWYELRAEKDIFSVYCQGGGSWIFFVWVYFITTKYKMTNILINYHDEVVMRCTDDPDVIADQSKNLKLAMEDVNNLLNLNVKFDIDTQSGSSYSDVH